MKVTPLIVGETPYLTLEQVIQYLNKSRGYVYRSVKANQLTLYKLGRTNLYRLEDVDKLISQNPTK